MLYKTSSRTCTYSVWRPGKEVCCPLFCCRYLAVRRYYGQVSARCSFCCGNSPPDDFQRKSRTSDPLEWTASKSFRSEQSCLKYFLLLCWIANWGFRGLLLPLICPIPLLFEPFVWLQTDWKPASIPFHQQFDILLENVHVLSVIQCHHVTLSLRRRRGLHI